MKIRKLTIRNYRGIKELDWNIPIGNIVCLIGKGDSSKSTILDCLRYVFYPQWNLLLSDADFYQCKTDNSIVIEATIGDLIDEFCSLSKYGQYLRGWDTNMLKIVDEPGDNLEQVLTIRLMVEKDLEPKWRVVCNRNSEGVDFSSTDRSKVSVSMIGTYNEKQFSWAKGTALSKLTNTENLSESLINASRTARNSLDTKRTTALKNFDEAAHKSQSVAKLLGVPVMDEYKAHLDLNSIDIKIGGLALHDGDMPLRQLGLGSRRMLLCGIQKEGFAERHITLFDEVEFGLEPHRIARLIKHIREDITGQYFLTTHSPIVLRELAVDELHIVHNKDGTVCLIAAADKNFEELEVQGKIRSSAEAFLAKKVVICEGATEVGFLRGYDDHRLSEGKDPFSYYGIALLDVNGASKISKMGKAFNALSYSTAVLADGDAPNHFSENDENNLTQLGVLVLVWDDKLSLEERAMFDLPWDSVLISVKLASELGSSAVYDNIRSATETELDKNIDVWKDTPSLRKAIGQAAKKSNWFKSITKGAVWFKAISPSFVDTEFGKTNLFLNLNKLNAWIEDV
jgi:putative ATP-dependent endonuclease of the OLD family